MRRRAWWIPWVVLFVVMVLAWKRCAEWYMGADDAPGAVAGYDPATWRPCPGRATSRVNGRRAVWFCGPDHPEFATFVGPPPPIEGRRSKKSR